MRLDLCDISYLLHHLYIVFLLDVLSANYLLLLFFSFSLENSNTEDQTNFQENFMKQLQSYLAPILFMGLLLSSFSFGSFDQKEVSYALITS